MEALTLAKIATLSHATLRQLIDTYPRIGQALWRDTAADAAISHEWLVSMGRRSAYQRMAHLLCELKTRLEAVGKVSDGCFAWPMTQAEVGDALGLSAVHVNRMLQQLRSEGLIATKGEEVRVLDWPRLRKAGEFSPHYLSMASDKSDGADEWPSK